MSHIAINHPITAAALGRQLVALGEIPVYCFGYTESPRLEVQEEKVWIVDVSDASQQEVATPTPKKSASLNRSNR